MLTILTIVFGGPKTYDYLMDPRSVFVPKANDIIKQFTGCSRYGVHYTEMTVVKITQTNVLPSHVKTVINLNDAETRFCKVYPLSAAAIAKLSKPPVETKKVPISKKKKGRKMWCEFTQKEKDDIHAAISRMLLEIVQNAHKGGS